LPIEIGIARFSIYCNIYILKIYDKTYGTLAYLDTGPVRAIVRKIDRGDPFNVV